MPYLYYLAVLGIPLLIVCGAVAVDLRTRRGFGQALLALTLLGLSVWLAVAFEQAMQQAPSSEQFAIGFVMIAYFLIGAYGALLLWIGALVAAWRGRQRRWLVGLVVAALLPVAFLLADNLLNFVPRDLTYMRDVELASIIFLPTLTVLAYGIGRIIRPAVRPAQPPTESTTTTG